MIVNVEREKKTIRFITQYNLDLITELKRVGAKWDGGGKYWYVRLNELDVVDGNKLWKKFQGLVRFCKNGTAEKLAQIIKELCQVEEVRVENVDVVVPQGLELFRFQVDGVREMLGKGQRVLLADEMGLGKEEYIGNRVWTPEGRKRIGDLKVGDKIFHPSGELVTVIGVYPQGQKELYRVTFNDGCSVLVGADHLWKVMNNRGCEFVLSTKQLMDEQLVIEHFGVGRNKAVSIPHR